MDNLKVAETKTHKFYCKKCDYYTNKTSSWKKHIETDKHKRLKWITEKLPTGKIQPVCNKFTCICGRTYKYKSGLSKHKKRPISGIISLRNMYKASSIFLITG